MAIKSVRYKGARNERRTVLVDLTGMEFPVGGDRGRFTAFRLHHEGKAHDPYHNLLGKRLKFETPEELQACVDEYFESCMGPAINKMGNIVYYKGEPVITQTQPYTRFGLILHLGMAEHTYYAYMRKAENGELRPEYGEILRAAQLKIDAQAERLLYDRDGSRGAEFYLKAFRKMTTKKEDAEINKINAQTRLSREEFELKKQLLGDDAGESELVVEVVRKRPRDE